jgi:hypothetical protein
MSFDYTQVTNELFSKIKVEHFNKNNESHMKVLEEILSKHIEDEELLFHMILSFKHSSFNDLDNKSN